MLGIVALLLASAGLYGVTSYSVAMRAREIAVRMALGVRADVVVAMVLRRALVVATIGSILGGLVAIAAGLLIRATVFGVAGVDLATLARSCWPWPCSWPASCRPGAPPGSTRTWC